ncbi:MAG: hypothetical protein Fur002_23610 [Anaerolineales bacterium]
MQFDAMLEVATGLVFVWLVVSVATLEIQNRVSGWLDSRAKHLEEYVRQMLKDEALIEQFYEHPLIQELTPKGANGLPLRDKHGKRKLPANIPGAKFAAVTCELLLNTGRSQHRMPEAMTPKDVQKSMTELSAKNSELGNINRYLLVNFEQYQSNMRAAMDDYRKKTEAWFDDAMQNASALYKLYAQKLAFGIGLLVACLLNIDTIYVAQKLWQEPTLRAALVAQAQTQAAQDQPADPQAAVRSLAFPVGWTTTPLPQASCGAIAIIDAQFVIRSAGECRLVDGLPAFNNLWGWLVKLTGYLLTAAAAAQGAPFWFDILRKLTKTTPQDNSVG